MSNLAQVISSLKARAASQITMFGGAVYWDKDQRPTLPDEPSPFVFLYIETQRGRFAEYGGGRGANLQRVPGELVGLVFLPKAWGLEQHAAYGEHVATAFRSYRDEYVSCFEAAPRPAVDGSNLKPAGLESEVVNYDCIAVSVAISYDQVG